MITVSSIAQANDRQLICRTYELLIEELQDAVQSAGKERKHLINKAKETLMVLTENLNLEVDLAKHLFHLYVYIQNIFINHWDDTKKLEEVQRLVDTILLGYKQISEKEGIQQPMMQNTQAIYAGMTYGRGYLEEQTWDSIDRGFKA